MNTKPCINKTFHRQLVTCFAPLHLQNFGNTPSIQKLAQVCSQKTCSRSYTDSDIVKLEEQMTLSEKFTESDFDLGNCYERLNKNHDS